MEQYFILSIVTGAYLPYESLWMLLPEVKKISKKGKNTYITDNRRQRNWSSRRK